MKKILVGKVIEEGHGKCDFCQSDDVDGYTGELDIDYVKAEYKETVKVIKGDYHINWKGDRVIQDWDFLRVYEPVPTDKTIHPLICNGCVKQLANIK